MAKRLSPHELIEGVHFEIENGLFVFTSFYLKERGFCCNNGCKNCPYGDKEDEDLIDNEKPTNYEIPDET